MAQSKREIYERKRAYVRELAEAGEQAENGTVPDTTQWPYPSREDVDRILEWCDAYDDEKATATPNGNTDYVGDDRWGSSRAPTTLKQWAISACQYSQEIDGSILDATAGELNRASQAFKDGKAHALSDRAKQKGGLSKNTVSSRQNCLIKFLQHYDDEATADPDAIHVFDKNSTIVDPSDMLTEEEFHAIRNAPEHDRDKAIVNLFLYTGQRNHALRTLRIKDVNLEEGTYRLNTSVDGLKGAETVGTWNSLLGAKKPIRDWLKHHPKPDDPDAYLLTERRDHTERDPYSTISDDTVNRALRRAAEIAAKEYPDIKRKPTYAHAMRHNFVTMCKVRFDMDDGTIKRLIRHKPGSTVMETTYAHLSDEDYISKAERAFGIRDEDDEEDAFDPSPNFCDTCDEPLKRGAKACPGCGMVYAPDAKFAQEKMQEQTESMVTEVENEEEARMVQAFLKEIRENPTDTMDS